MAANQVDNHPSHFGEPASRYILQDDLSETGV